MSEQSSTYRIFETEPFVHNLNKMSPSIGEKLEQKLRNYVYPQLSRQPHFGLNIKKLRDWKPETWRYRVGNWRFFYEINEEKKIVFMIALDQRKDAY